LEEQVRLLRIHTPDGLRDAVLAEDGHVVTLPGAAQVFDLDRWRDRATAATDPAVEFESVTLAAPLSPGTIVCVGLNYADHAAEGGQEAPAEPILFMKAPDTVVGAHDDVVIPRGSEKTDWEVELGVVIGRPAAYLADEAEAMEHVAGYVLANDVSERHFQLERGGQWDKGKNSATFCPLGPWILTADEVPDPQAIKLGLDVNGKALQDSSTAEMIFGVAHLVHYISQFMTLYPGDVINTGTPAGVALGQPDPKPYLRPGDVVELSIEGLGTQRQELKSA
jgi:2-keto-4-pentenoate hydratase/2-oxohepta-3-ene-1,7-dioic acid hydratase in catechol pathway